MFKSFILLAALGFTALAHAQAYSISCGSPQGFQQSGRSVELQAQGVWEPLEFGHARLSYELEFAIGCSEGEKCWARDRSLGQGVVANQYYEPKRYQNFQQFTWDRLSSLERASLLLPNRLPDSPEFRAYAMLEGVHGTFGVTVPLLCKGQALMDTATGANETAAEQLARANRIIQGDYGFSALNLHVQNQNTLQSELEQSSGNSVSLARATSLAMALILDDFDAIEGPLAVAGEGCVSTREQKEAARTLLRDEMRNAPTSLTLHLGGSLKGKDYPPEQGESPRDNWIFVLRVPTLSDHIYWVIVDRKGAREPYLYGFN